MEQLVKHVYLFNFHKIVTMKNIYQQYLIIVKLKLLVIIIIANIHLAFGIQVVKVIIIRFYQYHIKELMYS